MITKKGITTLSRFLIDQERGLPEATGAFSYLFSDLSIAAKVVNSSVNRAGLVDVFGFSGSENVYGEAVKKLDEIANDTIIKAMDHGGHVCVMASEENEDIIPIPNHFKKGNYVLMFDPLDGSSNIEANSSIGTIFSIYRRITKSGDGTLEDCLQPGYKQVCAGYFLYGSSTILVYSTGAGVHGFTFDPMIGEFLLSHEDIKVPKNGKTFSMNMGNMNKWAEGLHRYFDHVTTLDSKTNRPYSLRYSGSLVADFHRNLLYGGVFLYPGDKNNPKGKLRLLYEANPLAFIIEHAGGAASDGVTPILRKKPESLHERTPLFIGSKEELQLVEEFIQGKR